MGVAWRLALVVVLGCLGALMLGVTSAQAGTVTLASGHLRMDPVDEFGGQDNVVEISLTLDGQDLLISDSAGIPSPIPADCFRISFTQIACPFSAVENIHVNLGLGNDTFSTKEPPRIPVFDLDVDGGGGDDKIAGIHPHGSRSANVARVPFAASPLSTLTGGLGNDIVVGGEDAETISGDGGKDKLAGNGGNDRMFGGPAVDLILGGAGGDYARGGGGNDRGSGGPGNDDFRD